MGAIKPTRRPETVNEYIRAFARAEQHLLKQVRDTFRTAIPEAEETIAYGIPAYKVRGRTVIYFAGWKRHYSVYPATARLVAAFKEELAPYKVNDKGTIRFRLSEPVPVKLIAALAKFRASEVAASEKAKISGGKKR